MPGPHRWSTTASSNGNSDADIGMAEGMNASGLNDGVRGVMAGVKRYYQDTGGALTLGGGTTAYTVTTNQGYTAYVDGMRIHAVVNATSTAAHTLNVDGLGAKPVYKATTSGHSATTSADIVVDMHAVYEYDASLNGAAGGFSLLNPAMVAAGDLSNVAYKNTGTLSSAEVDVASASTCNIGAAAGHIVRITGTTTIAAFDASTAGKIVAVRFAAVLTLTNGANLALPGGSNITTAAGDSCFAVCVSAGTWRVYGYQKADGTAVVVAANATAVTASSTMTDNRLVRADGGSRGVQQSGITVDDSNNLSGIGTISSGAITSSGAVSGTTGSFSSTVSRTVPAFHAYKNGVDQTGVVNGTNTLVTMPSEVFDVGGYFSTANSRWTPPAGTVILSGAVYFSGTNIADGGTAIVLIYKNGSIWRAGSQVGCGGTGSPLAATISVVDQSSGTDYYELWASCSSSVGNKTIIGTNGATHFTGAVL